MLKKFLPFVIFVFATAAAFGQAQRMVLFEEFTGENCGPCAFTNPYMQQLVDSNPTKVIWMRYQCYIPLPGPLYYEDSADVDNRLTYYEGDVDTAQYAPWGQQDGAMWDSANLGNFENLPIYWCTDGNNPPNIITSYLDSEYVKPAPFTVNVTHSFTNTTDSFYAQVIITGADSFRVSAAGKLKLRVAMLETLNFTTPPGDNGETYFQNVVRQMYPDATGTPLADAWVSSQSDTFYFSGLVPDIIVDKTKVKFVAFAQDDNNLHVLQAGESEPYFFHLDAASQNFQGSFLQCSPSFTPVFTLVNNGKTTLDTCLIELSVDGANTASQTWTGSLAFGDTALVTLAPATLATGTHNLSIIAEKPNNLTDDNTGNDTTQLFVGVTVSTPVTTPLIEGFETASNPGWLVDGPVQYWSRYNVGDSSNYSYQMDFFDAVAGTVNSLYAPAFSLSGFTFAKMSFDRAYAEYNFGQGEFSDDSLYIEVSTDCGATWQTVYTNDSSTMATAPPDADYMNPFVPSASQWASDSADLSVVAGSAEVILRFRAVSGYGDELYIDNINIFGYNTAGINALNNVNALQLYPNPANSLVNVSMQLSNAMQVSYQVTDITGQVLVNNPVESRGSGQNNFILNTSSLPDGMYTLSVIAGGERISKPFGVTH